MTTRLLLGMSEVAALARVDRPLVSMWRRRYARSEHPFPAPAVRDGARNLFDAAEVAGWLSATGLGKNASAADDVALFSLVRGATADALGEAITAVSAFLALAAVSRSSLSGLDGGELLDLADDVDPHDLALFSEIEALGERRAEWAARTDAVIGAAYTPGAAFDALLGSHEVRGHLGLTAAHVSSGLAAFVARVAAHEIDPAVVLCGEPLTASLLELASAWDDLERPPLRLDDGSGALERFMRRAALTAGWTLEVASEQSARSTGITHLLDADVDEVLERVSDLSVTMMDGDRWVVVGSAAALVDRVSGRAADARADVLRTGRLHAVALLPAGLRPAHPRERLGLWVLGDAHAELAMTERWTSVSDLSGVRWAPAVAEDLFSDVAAALAGSGAVRAHASRFARVVPTAELVAANSMLVRPSARRRRATASAAEVALEVTALLELLDEPASSVELELWQAAGRGAQVATLGDLVSRGEVAVVRGCRLAEGEVGDGPGVRVLGRPEVASGAPGARTIDRWHLAAAHPSFRYTEPGDVVVMTDVPSALVDDAGLGVVEYPARAFRLTARATGLSPHVLAAAVRAARPGAPWRSWPVALAPPDQVSHLEDALDAVERVRSELVGRLAAADALRSTLTAGVTDGLLTLTPPAGSAEMSG